VRGHPSFEKEGNGLVPRRPHSPPFKGGEAAQRPGWLVKGREASFYRFFQEGGLFSRNAAMPSSMSSVRISSRIYRS